MLFHILTSVWGEAHWKIFLDAALPSILAQRNIPEIAKRHELIYRFYTTQQDQIDQSTHPLIKLLSHDATVEFATPLGTETPRADHHVHWIHRAATEARQAGAVLIIVPPDTMWNDGSFAFIARAFEAGKKAVITSLTQVVEETLIPEAQARFQPSPDAPLTVSGPDLVALSLRHLHPVTALTLPESPHGRPAIDKYWTVPREGLVGKHSQREMTAFDPRQMPMTFLWYPNDTQGDDIEFAHDSDDITMLSLDPLHKSFPTYILDHHVTSADIARMSQHPLNDFSLVEFYARQHVRWHTGPMTERAWTEVEDLADKQFDEVLQHHRFMRIWSAAQTMQCVQFGKLLAVASHVLSNEQKNFVLEAQMVLMPTDASLATWGTNLEDLAKPGNEGDLRKFLRHFTCTQSPEQALKSGSTTTRTGKSFALSRDAAGNIVLNGVSASSADRKPDSPYCLALTPDHIGAENFC